MKLVPLLLIVVFAFSVSAQTEEDIVNIVSRISQTKNVTKVLGYSSSEDSILHFDYLLPEMMDANFPIYEFESFILNIGMSSSDLVNGTAYGKIYIKDFGKKTAEIILVLNGVGDRLKDDNWNYAVYQFQKPKNSKWLLKDVEYFTKEIDNKLLGK